MVLTSAVTGNSGLPHDYLDDLESFYYVLCWICLGCAAPGMPVEPRPSPLHKWEQADADLAADSKYAFLSTSFSLRYRVGPYSGPIFQHLLSRLHDFFGPIVHSKLHRSQDSLVPKLLDLIPQAIVHYDNVLGYFDEAISSLERERAFLSPVTPTTASNLLSPVLASPHSTSSLKRRAKDNDFGDGSPTVKRSKRPGLRARNGCSTRTMESVDEES